MERKLPLIIGLVVVAALAGVGYWQRDYVMTYYQQVKQTGSWKPIALTRPSPLPPELMPSTLSPDYLPQSAAPTERRRPSRLPPPGSAQDKPFADTLKFYVLKRRVIRTADGVLAVSPGDTVELRERMRDGRLRVYVDGAEFIMAPSDLTQELAVARAAEATYLNTLR